MSLGRRHRRRRLWADSTGPAPLVVLALNRPIQILFFLFVIFLYFHLIVYRPPGPSEGYFPLTLRGDSAFSPASRATWSASPATDRGQIANITLWEERSNRAEQESGS